MTRSRQRGFGLGLALLLVGAAACRQEAANRPPTADAGPDRPATVGQLVTLDGSRSHDDDGDALSFAWRLTKVPSGSSVALEGADTAAPDLTPDRSGAYIIELLVSDGQATDQDTTVVTAALAATNRAPHADAGVDRSVAVGETTVLDARASTDPDGDPLSYSWSLESAPAGSKANLASKTGASSALQPDVAGSFTVRLTVSDGHASDDETVTITATATGSGNRTPRADAGVDQSVDEGARVSLDGSGSSDPDGDALSAGWAFVTWPDSGTAPAPTLSGAATLTASFTAAGAGSYTLELTVDDGAVSDADRVTITARSTAPGGTVYVDPNGDDGNIGRAADPVRTLKRALQLAAAYPAVMTVTLSDGTYAAGEAFPYTLGRSLLIQGQSQGGTVLSAGSQDGFALTNPSAGGGTVRAYLQDLTLDAAGTGLSLPTGTEAVITRVTCLHATPCVLAGEAIGVLPGPGGTLSMRSSRLTGDGVGSGLILVGGSHRIDDTTVSAYARGINAFAAAFKVTASTLRDNGTGLYVRGAIDGNGDGIVDPVRIETSSVADNGTGIHAERTRLELSRVTVIGSAGRGVESTGNADDGSVVLADSEVSGSGASGVYLARGSLEISGGIFDGNGTDNAGDPADRAGVYANTEGTLTVDGGTFSGNTNGFLIAGPTNASIQGVTARDNLYSGLSFRSTGTLTVRDSSFLTSGYVNLQVQGTPSGVDLGTADDAGNVWLTAGTATDWNLSDERPGRPSADGLVMTAVGTFFRDAAGNVGGFSGTRTGPASNGASHHWRITGANQRVAF